LHKDAGYPLFMHQGKVEPLLRQGPAILWWDMQTGKTRAILHAFDQLWQQGGPRQLLVVCPAYARATWIEEAEKMNLGLPVRTLFGITKRKIVGLEQSDLPSITLVSWDTLNSWVPYLNRGKPMVVALDESHEHAVNPETIRYQAVHNLVVMQDRAWLLTGTIYRRSAMDIYWQARLAGGFTKMTALQFGERFCVRRFNPFRGRNGAYEYSGLKPGVEAELTALIPNLSRVREEDCYDVPPVRRIDRWVDVGTGYKGGDNEANMEEARSRLVPLKIQRSLEFINDLPQRPIVIFGWHTAFVEGLAAKIPGASYITGATPPIRRAEIKRDFQLGRIPVLVANLKSFSLSVSLTASSHVIFGEVHWSETDHRQAEGRIKGISQRAPHITYTYLMVKNSIEEYVWNNKLAKGRAMDRVDAAVKIQGA
jgi:hypothetical protein